MERLFLHLDTVGCDAQLISSNNGADHGYDCLDGAEDNTTN